MVKKPASFLKPISNASYFEQYYDAAAFQYLYDVSLIHVVENFPQHFYAVPTQRVMKIAAKKTYHITLLNKIVADKELFDEFYTYLPDSVQKMLNILVWEGKQSVPRLERLLNVTLLTKNPIKNQRNSIPNVLKNEYKLAKMNAILDSNGTHIQPAQYELSLHDSFVQKLRLVMKQPRGYTLKSVKKPPQKTLLYSCENEIYQDITILMHIKKHTPSKKTKLHTLSVAQINKHQSFLTGQEFYPTIHTNNLSQLRTKMLCLPIFNLDDSFSDVDSSTHTFPEVIRDIIDYFFATDALWRTSIFNYSQPMRSIHPPHARTSGKQLLHFLATKLCDDAWYYTEDIAFHIRSHGWNALPFKYDVYMIDFSKATRADLMRISMQSKFDLTIMPIIYGLFFFFAACGLAEIAYTPPPGMKGDSTPFQSLFHGLKAIRFTALGRFVLNLSHKEPLIEKTATSNATLEIDPKRLLISISGSDPFLEVELDGFMERISSRWFKMTTESLLRNCASEDDISRRIDWFRRTVKCDLPAVWENFFDAVYTRCKPFTVEKDQQVFLLRSDKQLLHAFTHDPFLREHSIKAEGGRVIIEQRHCNKVHERLELLGYLHLQQS